MKRFAVGLIIAALGIAGLVGIAAASNKGSPSSQEGDTTAATTEQGWLGIKIADVNERIRNHFQLTVDSGVAVIFVRPEGPGATAGLQPGDVFQAINGTPVETVDQAIEAIRALSAGTVVILTVLRGDTQLSIEATLAAHPKPPVLPYLRKLLGQGLPGNLLHADYEVLGPDNTVISVGLTLGKVESVTDAGLLTIVRKDDLVVEFQTTADTNVIVGRHPINLVGLKTGTPVLVVEKDSAVAVVIGWPRDLMQRAKKLHKRAQPHQGLHRDTPSVRAPRRAIGTELNPEVLRESALNSVPGPELRESLREALQEWRSANGLQTSPAEVPSSDQIL